MEGGNDLRDLRKQGRCSHIVSYHGFQRGFIRKTNHGDCEVADGATGKMLSRRGYIVCSENGTEAPFVVVQLYDWCNSKVDAGGQKVIQAYFLNAEMMSKLRCRVIEEA